MGDSDKPAAAGLDAPALVDLPARCAHCGSDSEQCRIGITPPLSDDACRCCARCVCDLPIATSPARSPAERDEQIGTELARLRSAVAALARVQITSVRPAPPEPRHSLPVRAAVAGARGGYRLTKGAAAVLGLIVALAQALAPDHAVLRSILKALFEAL